MQFTSDKFLMFSNRLRKVYKHLNKQARRTGVSCYRLYDHDLPEFPFIIELYDDKLYVSEYKRLHRLSEEAHVAWLQECRAAMAEVIGIDEAFIFIKTRQRKEGRQGQYQKIDETKTEFVVIENGLQFIVNLSDYLDTGLFLDHRITRQMVREEAKDKRLLNLFCYTGSFSVYAAAGGASQIVSVDLSKTYLNWAQRNIQLNFPQFEKHQIVHADVLQYLKRVPANSFDIIILDPPTFSNSKRMEDFFDVQQDHVLLINECLRILTDQGTLYFSTNFSKFVLEREKINAAEINDVTRQTTPFDFEGKLNRYCFKIRK